MSVKRQILQMNEATMPGDVAFMGSVGTAEGEPIWNRMAAIIRKHALDIRLLMDAHDRRNRGFVDVSTFRRSLCYAFGNQWIELAMTSIEFEEICTPYKSRAPHAKGEPEAFIMWQKFASDLQTLANTRRPSQNFLAKLEQVEAKERLDQELQAKWGLDIFTLTSALHAIKERLLTYNTSINKAFQRIDANNNGTVSRAEILAFFKDAHIGNIVSTSTLDVIMAYCDENNDDEVAATPPPPPSLLPAAKAPPDATHVQLSRVPGGAEASRRAHEAARGPNCSPRRLPLARAQINYNELAGLIMAGDILARGVPEKREIKQEKRVGRAQVPVSQLRKAQKLISASPPACQPLPPAGRSHDACGAGNPVARWCSPRATTTMSALAGEAAHQVRLGSGGSPLHRHRWQRLHQPRRSQGDALAFQPARVHRLLHGPEAWRAVGGRGRYLPRGVRADLDRERRGRADRRRRVHQGAHGRGHHGAERHEVRSRGMRS